MSTPQTQGRAGLHYFQHFVTPEEQAAVVSAINDLPWRNDLKRRVQHYGYVYDYRAKVITPDHYLGPLPEFLQPLAERLFSRTGLFDSEPVQAIVNEYVGSQGISWHYDALTFGPAIATVSLLEPWSMEFARQPRQHDDSGEQHSLLEVGSALIMTGESRYRWRHSIPRISRERSGLVRGRRLSLTFRTLATK